MTIWSKLKHFSSKENWGNAKKISPLLLEVLDAYRDELGIPLHVSNALRYPNEFAPKVSAHYPDKNGLCRAVDIIPLIEVESLQHPDMLGKGYYPQTGEVVMWWGCGVTPQLAAVAAKIPFMITHWPAHLFISDTRCEDWSIL